MIMLDVRLHCFENLGQEGFERCGRSFSQQRHPSVSRIFDVASDRPSRRQAEGGITKTDPLNVSAESNFQSLH